MDNSVHALTVMLGALGVLPRPEFVTWIRLGGMPSYEAMVVCAIATPRPYMVEVMVGNRVVKTTCSMTPTSTFHIVAALEGQEHEIVLLRITTFVDKYADTYLRNCDIIPRL